MWGGACSSGLVCGMVVVVVIVFVELRWFREVLVVQYYSAAMVAQHSLFPPNQLIVIVKQYFV